MKGVRAASFPRDITYKGEGRGEEKEGGKKTRLKLGIYLRSQRNVHAETVSPHRGRHRSLYQYHIIIPFFCNSFIKILFTFHTI